MPTYHDQFSFLRAISLIALLRMRVLFDDTQASIPELSTNIGCEDVGSRVGFGTALAQASFDGACQDLFHTMRRLDFARDTDYTVNEGELQSHSLQSLPA